MWNFVRRHCLECKRFVTVRVQYFLSWGDFRSVRLQVYTLQFVIKMTSCVYLSYQEEKGAKVREGMAVNHCSVKTATYMSHGFSKTWNYKPIKRFDVSFIYKLNIVVFDKSGSQVWNKLNNILCMLLYKT